MSTKDEQEDRALQARRRQSVEGFWAKHGSVSDDGARRKSVVSIAESEVTRGQSVSTVGSMGKWRKMSWGSEKR